MGLNERISNNQGNGEGRSPEAPAPISSGLPKDRVDAAFDRQTELKTAIHSHVIQELGPRLYNQTLPEIDLRRIVRGKIEESLHAEQAPMPRAERQEMVEELMAEVLGYGPIEEFLHDPTITEVMVNGYRRRSTSSAAASSYKTEKRFRTTAHLMRIIDKIVGQVGRRVDESSPWSTPACPTAPASTPSSRRSPSTGRRAHHPQVLGRPLHGRGPHRRSRR